MPPVWDRAPRRWRLLVFLALHAATGTAAALLFVAAILFTDTAGLRTLASTSQGGFGGVALLLFGAVVVFASLAMGAGVMTLPRDRGYGEQPVPRAEDDHPAA